MHRALLTDLAFRGPRGDYAAALTGRVHLYEFDWRSPACNGQLDACPRHRPGLRLRHARDRHRTARPGRRDPPQALADRIHATWCRFAANGSLDWDTFDPRTRVVQRLAAAHAVREHELPIRPFLQ